MQVPIAYTLLFAFINTALLIMSVGTKCCSTRVYVMMAGLVGMVAYLLNAYATDASQLLLAQGFLFGKQSGEYIEEYHIISLKGSSE